jgi:hypothetical protein
VLLNGWDVRLDPWAVEYGGETPGAAQVEEHDEQVDIDVERRAADWLEIRPKPATDAASLIFVDGVRRIESRLIVSRDAQIVHGAIGSFGVGAVRVTDGRARFAEQELGRVIVFGCGVLPAGAVTLGAGLIHRPISVADDDADAPVRALHAEMRECEARLAAGLAGGDALVIADGPLNIGPHAPGRVVGFVKRLFRLYLQPDQLAVVRGLSPGSRSPVFLVRSADRFSRYSWFVRLGAPLRMESEFTGIVRLEVAEAAGSAEAVRLADALTSLLPRFVPSRARDPRAPQNLTPIGALEQHLRHELGNPRLIQRRLATLLAGGRVNV